MRSWIRLFLINTAGLLLVPSLAVGALSTKKDMPDFLEVTGWVNSDPLTRGNLLGKVVLVHFWNLTCAACLRDVPYLYQWSSKYDIEGLKVIGVHTPDLDWEKSHDKIARTIDRHYILYPVAIDSDRKIWDAFYPPTKPIIYLIDARGRIRHVFTGQISYDEIELLIQDLLIEMGQKATLEIANPSPLFDSKKRTTKTLHFGYRKLNGLGNREKLIAGRAQDFSRPSFLDLDTFYLNGSWEITENYARLHKAPGSLVSRYRGNGVNIVAGTRNRSAIQTTILIDGLPIPENERSRRILVNEQDSLVLIGSYDLYQLANHGENYDEKLLMITFDTAGIDIYNLSFEAIQKIYKKTEEEIAQENLPPPKIKIDTSFDEF